MKYQRKILLAALVSLGIGSAFAAGFEPKETVAAAPASAPAPVILEASVPASIFDSPYLGIQAGGDLSRHTLKHSSSAAITGHPQLNDAHSTSEKRRGKAGLYAGLGKVFDRFYLGGEIFDNVSFSGSKSSVTTVNGTGANANDVLVTKVRSRLKNSYGFDIRPGVLVTPEALIYLIGGLQRTQSELKLDSSFVNGSNAADTGALSLSKKRQLTGYRYGVGLQHRLADNFSARIEYVGVTFRKPSSKRSEVSGQTTNSFGSQLATASTFKPTNQNTVMLGLSYHFL